MYREMKSTRRARLGELFAVSELERVKSFHLIRRQHGIAFAVACPETNLKLSFGTYCRWRLKKSCLRPLNKGFYARGAHSHTFFCISAQFPETGSDDREKYP